jgi:hypothetical protein
MHPCAGIPAVPPRFQVAACTLIRGSGVNVCHRLLMPAIDGQWREARRGFLQRTNPRVRSKPVCPPDCHGKQNQSALLTTRMPGSSALA